MRRTGDLVWTGLQATYTPAFVAASQEYGGSDGYEPSVGSNLTLAWTDGSGTEWVSGEHGPSLAFEVMRACRLAVFLSGINERSASNSTATAIQVQVHVLLVLLVQVLPTGSTY